jgi:hypothetical protein
MTVPALSAIARSVCVTTVTSAIPVVNAKAKAKTKAIFFMAVPPVFGGLRLPKLTRPIRDRDHVLELFQHHQTAFSLHFAGNPLFYAWAKLSYRTG